MLRLSISWLHSLTNFTLSKYFVYYIRKHPSIFILAFVVKRAFLRHFSALLRDAGMRRDSVRRFVFEKKNDRNRVEKRGALWYNRHDNNIEGRSE